MTPEQILEKAEAARRWREAVAEARSQALEEAARAAEEIWDSGKEGGHGGEQANRTAAAIRALKTPDRALGGEPITYDPPTSLADELEARCQRLENERDEWRAKAESK